MKQMQTSGWRVALAAMSGALVLAAWGSAPAARGQGETSAPATRVAVVFSGGHETDPRDGGRPVTLIAGALGVAPEVFRQAFSHVRPAHAGTRPDPEQVRRNKDVLMSALQPHGITNDRLDTVSNYYRYNRSRGEMWPTRPAAAVALVRNGAVIGFEVTSGGSGYNAPPAVGVPGAVCPPVIVSLGSSKTLQENGSVRSITFAAKPGK